MYEGQQAKNYSFITKSASGNDRMQTKAEQLTG